MPYTIDDTEVHYNTTARSKKLIISIVAVLLLCLFLYLIKLIFG